ncbi:unnamed protein product [Prunus armeniaca]|uniref:Retrotransposon Copia-like N-terminal domain-containing protein n=1 Tax=Prunus armeniaca TaxID=36596 RepID=A0A6J5XBW1_PRUAR|nr:unnamed protein product [Prunus armeniaca]
MTTPEASLVLPHSSSTSAAQPPTSSVPQIVTIQNDNSALPTRVILNETNYALWYQLMEIRIATRGKLGYLTGSIAMPAESATTFDAWTTENLQVKGWLIDSMSPELMGRFIRLRTAKEIWAAVKKVFYDGSDESQVYKLNRKAFTLKQNGQPVSKYYSMLQSLFQELDHSDPPSMVCVADTDAYQKKLDRLRVHIFLFGLDPEFDQVHRNLNWILTRVLLMFAVMHNNAPILLVLPPLLMLLSWWFNVPRDHLHLMGVPRPRG